MTRVVQQQSEKLVKAVKAEGETKLAFEKATVALTNRQDKYKEAQEGLFAAQAKMRQQVELQQAEQASQKSTSSLVITRQHLLTLLAAASTMGPDVQAQTVKGIQMLEAVLGKPNTIGGSITPPTKSATPPSTPIRRTGRRDPTFVPHVEVSPARKAAAEAAKKSALAVEAAEKALAKADQLDQAARDEEMEDTPSANTEVETPYPSGETDSVLTPGENVVRCKATSCWQLPDPIIKGPIRVQFQDDSLSSDSALEGRYLAPTIQEAGQTSLHAFLHAKKGTKSRTTTVAAERVKKARLAHVGDARQRADRSRSPIQSSSEGKADAEGLSGFGAAQDPAAVP